MIDLEVTTDSGKIEKWSVETSGKEILLYGRR
jgi:hypothetical protein